MNIDNKNEERKEAEAEAESEAWRINNLPPASLLEKLYFLSWGIFSILFLILLVLFFKL